MDVLGMNISPGVNVLPFSRQVKTASRLSDQTQTITATIMRCLQISSSIRSLVTTNIHCESKKYPRRADFCPYSVTVVAEGLGGSVASRGRGNTISPCVNGGVTHCKH